MNNAVETAGTTGRVVITGTGGLGFETALALSKIGWKVNSIYYCDSYEDGSHSISMYSIDDSSASLDNLKFEKSSKITHQVQLELTKGDNSQYIWIEFK